MAPRQTPSRKPYAIVFIPELDRLIAESDGRSGRSQASPVAVLQNGEVAFIRHYGLRDVETGSKVTTDTQF
jgi:CubicO group peptidase (beta-lactamase class C family)